MTNQRLVEHLIAPGQSLESSDTATVVLFGEALVDIFPQMRVWGGAPLNVARHLHGFGRQSLLVTCLGLDALGDELLQAITALGMQTSGIQRTEDYPTGRVEIEIGAGGHRFTIVEDQAYDYIGGESARAALGAVQPKLIYFGSLAQRSEISRTTLQGLLEDRSTLKFFDINLRSPWYARNNLERSLEYADILKLNDDELAVIAGMFDLPGQHLESRLSALLSRYRLMQIILTRGEEGAWLLTDDGTLLKVGRAGSTGTVVDTVGAGDAFSAVCIEGQMRGWPLQMTLEKANTFASAICGIRGALPEQRDFYQHHLDAWTP